MLLRSSKYMTPSLPPPTIRLVFGMSSAFWMPRSSSVAFRNDQLNGVNQSRSVPGRADLDEAVAEVPSARVSVERPVAGQRVEVADRIGRQSSAGLPDSGEAAVGRGVVDHDLLQARRVVAEDPAVIRTLIAVRRPRDVDGAVIEEQAGALIVRPRVERDVVLRVAPVAGAGHARLNDERAAGSLRCRRGHRSRAAAGRTCRSPSCAPTKYIVCDSGSMTGVPPMPMLPAKSR